ncbi:MAG: hypothetical protein EBQ96_02125 [Proteobacteria bacterium]|nr:hypothetical protein [Pseudomonadota bacterium]
MITALSVIPKAKYVVHTIGLDPESNPGLVEVINGLSLRYFQSQRGGMSREHFLEGLQCSIEYWKFVIDVVNDFAGEHISPLAMGFDPVYAAAIGGVDIVTLSKQNPDIYWKSESARAATMLMLRTASLKTADAFAAAGYDARYLSMVLTYADLCSQNALLDAKPEAFRHEPLEDVDGVGVAKLLGYPAYPSKLTDAILATEAVVFQKWRNLYVPPKSASQPHRFRIV